MTAIARMPSRAGMGGTKPLRLLAPGKPMLPLEHGSVGVRYERALAIGRPVAAALARTIRLEPTSGRNPGGFFPRERKIHARVGRAAGLLSGLDARAELAELGETLLERRVRHEELGDALT